MIEKLAHLTPSAARGERTKSRCHERLTARRRKIESRNQPSNRRTAIMVERLVLAGVCVVCLAAMAGEVLSIVRGL